MFAFLKRILRTIAFPARTATSPAAPRDEPKPTTDDRTLTPASWPGAEQKTTPFAWSGGCCG